LTDNDVDDLAPTVSGNQVAWYGWDDTDTEIYLYNGSTTQQLTDNETDDLVPVISGKNVVWQGWDDTDNEIYLYNGTFKG
jgi:beta propeller repeat protein